MTIAPSADRQLYFWGTKGGPTNYRHSAVYLARKRHEQIGQQAGVEWTSKASAPTACPGSAPLSP